MVIITIAYVFDPVVIYNRIGEKKMIDNITRFVSHEFRHKNFENMIEEISLRAAISPELIRQYSEKSLNDWEIKKGIDVLTLFTVRQEYRKKEISEMLKILRDYLRPIIFSRKKLDISLNIASQALESMYHIF